MRKIELKTCTQCGAPIDMSAAVCKYCGAEFTVQTDYQQPQYTPQVTPQYIPQQDPPVYDPTYYIPVKSKTVAGILAILFGTFGVHKFYLGKVGMGILYFILCGSLIPTVLGIIEGIIYLTSSQEKFDNKYVAKRKLVKG